MKELIDIISANPDLPIVAMVNGDVTEGEGMYWMAGISHVEVAEVGLVGERYYDSREDFKEAYYVGSFAARSVVSAEAK